MNDYEIIDGSLEPFSETVEVVEEVVDPIDYTEQIYDCTNSLISVLLFGFFLIVGFMAATQILGRTKV